MELEPDQARTPRREPRPFPAIDPEPAHRYSWRAARRGAIAVLAACAVAAVALAGVRLASRPAGARPGGTPATATRFADTAGLVVLEEQPSGQLATARPDGSALKVAAGIAGLLGSDLPVASPDGRYLVTDEGQLVTLGAAGPVSVTTLDAGAASESWAAASFADGSRYVVATECDIVSPSTSTLGPAQAWTAHLLATSGGTGTRLGVVTSAAGTPGSAAALLAVPAVAADAASSLACYGPGTAPDSALDLTSPGRQPAPVVTAAALVRAAGWPDGTPVQLSAVPSPDGQELAVTMTQVTQAGDSGPARSAMFLAAPGGASLARLPLTAQQDDTWSPDGAQLAACHAAAGQQTTVSVLTVAAGAPGRPRVIDLPGRRDLACSQLLWSPDGSQLIYSGVANPKGLTQADGLQHGWTVIDLRSGQAHDVTAPGQPAAWLP